VAAAVRVDYLVRLMVLVVLVVQAYWAVAGMEVVALGEFTAVVAVAVMCQALLLVAQEPQAWLFLNGDKYESTYSN
jgi:hypothetical protein